MQKQRDRMLQTQGTKALMPQSALSARTIFVARKESRKSESRMISVALVPDKPFMMPLRICPEMVTRLDLRPITDTRSRTGTGAF